MSHKMNIKKILGITLASLTSLSVAAQDPIDIGTLRNEEIQVVQRRLYEKADQTEMGVQLGVLPFDPYTIAPKVQLTYGHHDSESRAWEIQMGFGYGFANQTYRTLDSPAYGKVPEATRYLMSITGGYQFSPIYGKVSLNGERVFHHDIYFPVVAGVTIEQTVDEHINSSFSERLAIAPTIGAGIGARVFLHYNRVLRLEVRDDVMLQYRAGSGTWALKQNLGVHVGLTVFGGNQ